MFSPVQFGKYYLTERLAVGGMAEIFKAKLYGVSGFEKPMVVKQILPQHARNAEFIKMFIDEAKIAVSLTHGNIIPVYELGRINGIYFIAMEYVDGRNLAEILEEAIQQERPLSVELGLYVAIEICKGLDYAHRRVDPEGNPLGLVHRDVSPPNVMVSMTGEVKLADFGIAQVRDKLGRTEAGVVKGTYGYMSPEQVEGQPIGPRADIFSCGILLHEMLTGKRLFSGGNELEAIERVRRAEIPLPSSIVPSVPPELDEILARALARDAEQRFADANELQLALSRVLYSTGGGASAQSLASYMRQLFPRDQSEPALPLEEVTAREAIAPPKNITQSYAARELEPLATGETLLEVPPKRPKSHKETIATAGLPDPAREPPSSEDETPGDAEFTDFDQTAVYQRQEPRRPDVPELRFSVKSSLQAARGRSAAGRRLLGDDDVADALQAVDQLGDPPASEETPSSLAETVSLPSSVEVELPPAMPHEEEASGPALAEMVTQPDTPPAPPAVAEQPVAERIVARPSKKKRRDSSLMALLTRRGGTEEQATVVPSQPRGASESLPTVDPAGPAGPPPSRSGLLSSTMRLFVQGIDDQAMPSATHDALDDDPIEDVLPRTIKPTVLGWILILAIVVGTAIFVLSKKTDLLSAAQEDPAALGLDQIKPLAPARKPARGSLALTTEPDGAHIFLSLGDAPADIPADTGQQHLVRVERDGYRTVHRQLGPGDFHDQRAEITVTLEPIRAGGPQAMPPEITPGPPSGQQGTIRVTTDPPSASLWLLLGRGSAKLVDRPAKRYYFKALLPGHEMAFITVLPSEMERAAGQPLERVAKLDPVVGADASSPAAVKPSPKPSPTTRVVEPSVAAPRATAKRGTTRRIGRRRTPPRRPRRTRPAPQSTPKKAPAKGGKKPSLTVPSWAQ